MAALLVAAVLASIVVLALTFSDGSRNRRDGVDGEFVPDGAAVEVVSFSSVPGWRLDHVADALPAFLRSCARRKDVARDSPFNPNEYPGPAIKSSLTGSVEDWDAACKQAAIVIAQPYADETARSSAARAFFEFYFEPVRLLERRKAKRSGVEPRLEPLGLFTAYFEPVYPASDRRTAAYSAPVLARPDDLVTIDLGLFRPELKGQKAAGRVENGALGLYPDHAAINAGALAGRTRIIAWMRPTDLFFLQIQGSGRLRLETGEIRVGYDGSNGRPYTAIGKTLVGRGAMALEDVSMKTIREWLEAAKDDEARAVRESNASYVFFRVLDGLEDQTLGPLGAEGVQLTPGRSLAVDPRFAGYGAPVFISIDGDEASKLDPVRRLFIAQDTGGAIKGPVRGDIFVGTGALAGDVAGVFNRKGEAFLLVPKAVAENLRKAATR